MGRRSAGYPSRSRSRAGADQPAHRRSAGQAHLAGSGEHRGGLSLPYAQNPLLRDPYFRRHFGVPDVALEPRLSAGSGVIVDAARGLVLTNAHVVKDGLMIVVMLQDQRKLEARLVGVSPDADIAVLQIRLGT
jgi:S1-C subfamily serine protease